MNVLGNCLVDKPEKSDNIIASTVAVDLSVVQGAVNEQYMPPRNAWVLCDDCHKWRRIPASLVDSLGHASCTWYAFILPFISHICMYVCIITTLRKKEKKYKGGHDSEIFFKSFNNFLFKLAACIRILD